jgi:hypothetical protein
VSDVEVFHEISFPSTKLENNTSGSSKTKIPFHHKLHTTYRSSIREGTYASSTGALFPGWFNK